MGLDERYPDEHAAFLARCHEAGQVRPTPLLLQYVPGDFNCLHQDVYGELTFPLQVAILLSEPGRDFTGGELALTEQRPRMQSRVEVVPLRQGDAVVFAVHHRPVQGAKGTYRVNMRHGVSRLRSGIATRSASSSTMPREHPSRVVANNVGPDIVGGVPLTDVFSFVGSLRRPRSRRALAGARRA